MEPEVMMALDGLQAEGAQGLSMFPGMGMLMMGGGIMIGLAVVLLALVIFMIIATCKVYIKAGRAWWEAIIPVYSIFIYFRIIKLSCWWMLILLLPLGLAFIDPTGMIGLIINIIFSLFLTYRLAKVFGHGIGFTIGLLLLPIIFFPILAFGKSKYEAIAAAPQAYQA